MPPLGWFPSEYRHPVWCGNTSMVWLPDGEKNFEDMFIRFDIIDECDRQTDRHRMTAIAALMHSIAQQKLVEHYPDTLTLTDITLAATGSQQR